MWETARANKMNEKRWEELASAFRHPTGSTDPSQSAQLSRDERKRSVREKRTEMERRREKKSIDQGNTFAACSQDAKNVRQPLGLFFMSFVFRLVSTWSGGLPLARASSSYSSSFPSPSCSSSSSQVDSLLLDGRCVATAADREQSSERDEKEWRR